MNFLKKNTIKFGQQSLEFEKKDQWTFWMLFLSPYWATLACLYPSYVFAIEDVLLDDNEQLLVDVKYYEDAW
jgi:hypothetical protein